MKLTRIALIALAAITLAVVTGCSNDKPSTDGDAVAQPSDRTIIRQQNDDTADALIDEARQAERNGNYAHAMEVYQYLKGFPADSRPDNLDQRIKAVQDKMLATAKPQ